MKILWSGPFLSDRALSESCAADHAAVRWGRGLLRGLEENGCELWALDHCPNQIWPKGGVCWQDNAAKWFLDWYPCERMSYLNVPVVKDLWLSAVYARATRRVLNSWCPDAVLLYNSLHPFNVAVMRVAAEGGVPVVPIILDGDDPRGDNWTKLLHDNRYASGIVFLSDWMYKNYPNRSVPILHMDGGADRFRGKLATGDRCLVSDEISTNHRPKAVKFTLVHTGTLDYWRGLEFMKGVVKACHRDDVRFVFCGKCDRRKVWTEFGEDPRVEVRGFLPNEKVDELCRSADVLLSVREPNVADNVVNYPSKIPQYLSWGVPIVSTWVPSFSDDYREVLEVTAPDPVLFACKIDEVLAWDMERRVQKFNQIKTWFETRKSWKIQAGRLVSFVSGLTSRVR